jgi:drug/metabolite transporter (DMT)-like permease
LNSKTYLTHRFASTTAYETPSLPCPDSVHYLPLAEATIFRFLVPIVTAWACSILLAQVFTNQEIGAGLVAMAGVVIIAHPAALFGHKTDGGGTGGGGHLDVSPAQRLIAIAVSLLGVLGASGAYTMIRVIGDRAHALISVNYFALICTVGSTAILLLTPGIGFTAPQGPLEWSLLTLLGVLGFVLQFLLTAGLQLDRSSKATSMMYTQVLFALVFDWSIWGVFPGRWSLVGGAMVIASTLWSALRKPRAIAKKHSEEALVVDEESPLLGHRIAGEPAQRRASSH